jgi:hypothetical protein
MARELVAHNKPVFDQLHPNMLPLGAVAFGLTALGIVFLICANTAP